MKIPGSTWYYNHQYGSLDTADLPNQPRELNPYERLRIRLMFGVGKAVVFVVAGAVLGGGCFIGGFILLEYLGRSAPWSLLPIVALPFVLVLAVLLFAFWKPWDTRRYRP